MIETGLYQLLIGDATVNGLVNGAVYFTVLPEGSPFPAVVMLTASSSPLVALDGTANLQERRFQFDCYAKDDFLGARALSNAVKGLLEDYAGTLPNGDIVEACVLNLEIDAAFDTGGSSYTSRAILDISILFKEIST